MPQPIRVAPERLVQPNATRHRGSMMCCRIWELRMPAWGRSGFPVLRRVRFEAEVPDSDSLDPDDHSYSYTMGSESLHSMAANASGHGDALGHMGALAGERMPRRVGIRAETIELPFGLGEIDLPAAR